MIDAVYRLLTLNRNAAISAFNILKKLKGLDCVVTLPPDDSQPPKQYQPGRRGSIFGLEDLVEYDDDCETYSDTLLIFNLFQESYAGYEDYDTFISGTYCLTLGSERLPLQTLIEVNFYGRKMAFKVDDHKNLSPYVVDQLFIKNMLVPAT